MTVRIRWSGTLKALTLASAVLGAACGGFVDGTGETGYRTIDASGGEVRARDAEVTVPVDAVDTALTVTIAPVPVEDPLPEGAAGKAIDVGPDGATFLRPVTVQLAFDPDALPDPTRPDLTWVGVVVDGEWEPLVNPVVDLGARVVRGATFRSGRFGVVHGCGRGRRCPVALAFDSPPQQVEAGACSGAMVLKTIDAAGRRAPVMHDTAVALSVDSEDVAFRFYWDDQCQREISPLGSSITLPAGQTDATFYFRVHLVAPLYIHATARDLQRADQLEAIFPGPGATLRFSTQPQQLSAGACSSLAVVALQDASGAPAAVSSNARVTLSASSTAGTVTFYSDSTCTTPTSGVAMPTGASFAMFWFKDDLGPTAGGETITLTASLGAFGSAFTASQDEVVRSPPPAALRFYSLPQTVSVGACSGPTTVGLMDASGNRTVATASTPVAFQTSAGMALYADSACTVQVSSATIAAGSGSTTVYFKAFNAGTYTITASSSGLTSASQDETVP